MRILLWVLISFVLVYLLSPRAKKQKIKKTIGEFWSLLIWAVLIFLAIEIILYFTDFHL